MKARIQFPTTRLARDSHGVTMVEFALVAMFLVMVLFGTFDLGWAVYTNNTVSLAAREGARKGIIKSVSDSTIIQQVKSTAAGLNLQDSNITISRTSDSDGNNFVTVTVTYKYTPLTPFISRLLPSGYLTLTGKATMYVEG
jgi:Flp pilus assembly protein TadG